VPTSPRSPYGPSRDKRPRSDQQSSGRFSQASRSNRSGAHSRSKKRIIAGAIAGGIGGFFGGGFLGAHIEGDRCNSDDPGVRGFLIGAPIGAVAGGILGAKFIF
jgi:hypothetical protein